MRHSGLVTLALLVLTLWTDLGQGLPRSQATFARDMRGDVMYNVADTGMIMGLGRRKRSDYFSEELNKRHSAFLEDTGYLMGFGKRSPEKRHYSNSFLGDTGFMMNLGKRSHNRNAFLEDTGLLMGLGKRNPLKGIDLIRISGNKRLESNNRINLPAPGPMRTKVSKDSDDRDYLVYKWQ